MSNQLDILALEPFYGGIRRHMLETLIRYSRHRWTLFRLPPRRIERRLAAAAHWFTEHLSRHWVGKFDVLFTSEAMNLSDLYRLNPPLARKPSVIYFHHNQLPTLDGPEPDSPIGLDLVNLGSATSASETWFNSLYHLKDFLARASALVQRHPELSARNPMPNIVAKSHLLHPPIDLPALSELLQRHPAQRKKHLIFVETRDGDVNLLNSALAILMRRDEPFELVTVGPVNQLAENLPRRTVSEYDDHGQMQALAEAGMFLSIRRDTTCDYHAIRALMAGCVSLWPRSGFYGELLPERYHARCLYDPSPEELAGRMLDEWYLEQPPGRAEQVHQTLRNFDPIVACKVMDQRLEDLAGHGPAA